MSSTGVTVVALFKVPDDCYVEPGGGSAFQLGNGGGEKCPSGHVRIPPTGADTVLDFTVPALHFLRKDGGTDAIKARFELLTMLEATLAISNMNFNQAVSAANVRSELTHSSQTADDTLK